MSQNNLFKHVAGLDPTNPASVFTVCVGNTPDQPTQQNLVFRPMVDGRTYTLQFSSDVIGRAWLPLTDCSCPVTNGDQVTISDTNAVESQKFHRIGISLP